MFCLWEGQGWKGRWKNHAGRSRDFTSYYFTGGNYYVCDARGSVSFISERKGDSSGHSIPGEGADARCYWDAGGVLPEGDACYGSSPWDTGADCRGCDGGTSRVEAE